MKTPTTSRMLFGISALICAFTGVYAVVVGNTKFGITFICIGVVLATTGLIAHGNLRNR